MVIPEFINGLSILQKIIAGLDTAFKSIHDFLQNILPGVDPLITFLIIWLLLLGAFKLSEKTSGLVFWVTLIFGLLYLVGKIALKLI